MKFNFTDVKEKTGLIFLLGLLALAYEVSNFTGLLLIFFAEVFFQALQEEETDLDKRSVMFTISFSYIPLLINEGLLASGLKFTSYLFLGFLYLRLIGWPLGSVFESVGKREDTVFEKFVHGFLVPLAIYTNLHLDNLKEVHFYLVALGLIATLLEEPRRGWFFLAFLAMSLNPHYKPLGVLLAMSLFAGGAGFFILASCLVGMVGVQLPPWEGYQEWVIYLVFVIAIARSLVLDMLDFIWTRNRIVILLAFVLTMTILIFRYQDQMIQTTSNIGVENFIPVGLFLLSLLVFHLLKRKWPWLLKSFSIPGLQPRIMNYYRQLPEAVAGRASFDKEPMTRIPVFENYFGSSENMVLVWLGAIAIVIWSALWI